MMMNKKQWEDFEQELLGRGYTKWTDALHGKEDFDMSMTVRDGDKAVYELIFRFWNFEKYGVDSLGEYAVDFVVMPLIDGRMDATCSSMGDGTEIDVDFAERFARDYYQLVESALKRKRIRNDK